MDLNATLKTLTEAIQQGVDPRSVRLHGMPIPVAAPASINMSEPWPIAFCAVTLITLVYLHIGMQSDIWKSLGKADKQ